MIKKRLKSKTYLLSLAVTALGVVELNFHLLQQQLGEHYGVAFIVIAAASAVCRELTSTSISDK